MKAMLLFFILITLLACERVDNSEIFSNYCFWNKSCLRDLEESNRALIFERVEMDFMRAIGELPTNNCNNVNDYLLIKFIPEIESFSTYWYLYKRNFDCHIFKQIKFNENITGYSNFMYSDNSSPLTYEVSININCLDTIRFDKNPIRNLEPTINSPSYNDVKIEVIFFFDSKLVSVERSISDFNDIRQFIKYFIEDSKFELPNYLNPGIL